MPYVDRLPLIWTRPSLIRITPFLIRIRPPIVRILLVSLSIYKDTSFFALRSLSLIKFAFSIMLLLFQQLKNALFLTSECELKVHVDDLVDLILRIFQANGHNEQQENIKEWFCGEDKIDFWSFFSQLTEKFVGLLQVHVVQEIHTKIVSELLKEGRMEKKGHVVHNWKTRWFVLTASSLNYFESHDNLILKVKNPSDVLIAHNVVGVRSPGGTTFW